MPTMIKSLMPCQHVTGGRIYVEANGLGVILKSPGGSCHELTVTNAGTLVTTPLVCQ